MRRCRQWVFGCDVCQAVCPWNRRPLPTAEPAFQPAEGMNPVELAGWFFLDEPQFRQCFRRSPLASAKRRRLLRNAAMVLGNCPHAAALPGLIRGLNDPEPLVRGACAWSLGRYAQPEARAALQRASPPSPTQRSAPRSSGRCRTTAIAGFPGIV